MSIESYLRLAPKAELHVHLEGSMQPHTLLELAERNGIDLPASTVGGLKKWFQYRDFPHFIEIYVAITHCLKTAEDYELIVVEFGAEMARQNVRYAEATFSPGTHHSLGIADEVFLSGLKQGRARARDEFGVEINWVFDIVRDAPLDRADYTTSIALDYREEGVVALGLGGMEEGFPPESFAPFFERALAEGLHSDPHAGEIVGPESVWGAIRALHAERIGHGVHAVEDPALVEYLAEHRIPLEVCPTSNIRLGVFPDVAAHPFRRLRESGVIVTVNSDDPPLFNTTLNDEVQLLRSAFGFDADAIDEILLDGVRHSFLPPDRRAALEAEFRAQQYALRIGHLR